MAENRELAAAIVFLQKLPGRIDAYAHDVAAVGASMASPSGTGVGARVSRLRTELRTEIAMHAEVLERIYRG